MIGFGSGRLLGGVTKPHAPRAPTSLRLVARPWLAVLGLAALIGCGDEAPEPTTSTGLPDAVQQILSEEDVARLEALGLTIHRGSTPPNVEGRFLMDTVTLVASSFEDPFQPGHRFVNGTYEFSEQMGPDLIVRRDEEGLSMGDGTGGFISGADGSFSVYAALDSVSRGVMNRTVEIYSGRLGSDGIEEMQVALYMVSKEGDDNDAILIPEGTGRLIEEQDGLAVRQ